MTQLLTNMTECGVTAGTLVQIQVLTRLVMAREILGNCKPFVAHNEYCMRDADYDKLIKAMMDWELRLRKRLREKAEIATLAASREHAAGPKR